METIETKTLTIERVDFLVESRWVEIWFTEPTESRESLGYDESCKTYMLWDVIQKAGYNEIINHGLKGCVVEWQGDRPISIKLP